MHNLITNVPYKTRHPVEKGRTRNSACWKIWNAFQHGQWVERLWKGNSMDPKEAQGGQKKAWPKMTWQVSQGLTLSSESVCIYYNTIHLPSLLGPLHLIKRSMAQQPHKSMPSHCSAFIDLLCQFGQHRWMNGWRDGDGFTDGWTDGGLNYGKRELAVLAAKLVSKVASLLPIMTSPFFWGKHNVVVVGRKFYPENHKAWLWA